MPKFDIAIIGSGLAGLHAASAVVGNKASVIMIDVGFNESATLEQGENVSFEEERRTDPSQHRIFLGDDLSGVSAPNESAGHSGNMTSGRRSYVTRASDKYSPIKTDGAIILQSLARGGLSEAWGAVCGFFDDEECRSVGLPPDEMKESYRAVIKRIGVSGDSSDFDLLPPAFIDENAQSVLQAYNGKRSFFDSSGFKVSRPPLALLTSDFGSRKKTEYRDMDFWDNIGRSVYRGHYTLEALLGEDNFTYADKNLVTRVENYDDHVIVRFSNIENGEESSLEAKVVIVALGAINTTRLLLRSFGLFDKGVPVLIKDNFIIPCVLLNRLGKEPTIRRHSLCQLAVYDEEQSSYSQLYSYNSLLLHKLLPYVPMPKPEALSLLSLFVPSIMLADVRFPSAPNMLMSLKKASGGGDFIDISHFNPEGKKIDRDKQLGRIKKSLIRLGLVPLKTVHNPFGVAAHYAGGVPFGGPVTGQILSANEYGQLHNARRIFIADSATWKVLPAKPPALTIMANADRIGRHVKNLFLKSLI